MAEPDYNKIARFYDDVVARDEGSAYHISHIFKQHNIKSVLELGCGTGEILKYLQQSYRVDGVDISDGMLKIAKTKLKDSRLYCADILDFIPEQKYDSVICVYDTVNHLSSFAKWKKLFNNVSRMLSKNGVFLFDVNTINKLEYLCHLENLHYKFNDNHLVININKLKPNTYNWHMNVFEHSGNNTYNLTEQDIIETAYKAAEIKKALTENFKNIKLFSETFERASDSSDRIYFLCIKK